jgi:hypothetical protein
MKTFTRSDPSKPADIDARIGSDTNTSTAANPARARF